MTDKPLRVLFLTTSFPLRKESQSGAFILRMIEQLPAGIQVTVLTPDDSSTEHGRDVSCCTLVRFRYAPKRWQRLAHSSGGIMAALAQSKGNLLLLPLLLCSCFAMCCLLARKADVMHANWSVNGAIAGLIGLLWRKPVITTLRGSDVNLAAKSWLLRQVAASCLSLSKATVTVSPALHQSLVRLFPRHAEKIAVIANGIDPAFFAVGKKRARQDGPLRLLYAGNLVPGKGVHVILQAAAMLATESWHLDIVGDGPEREKLAGLCQESGLQAKVRFHGSVAPEQMPLFMGRADVFVFASFAEGRPNAVLEAMAAGLPVLAAAIPAVQELIEDGKQGLLFPPGDARQLGQHLSYLLARPEERRRMGENARTALAALGLSWPETARQYAALYQAAVR